MSSVNNRQLCGPCAALLCALLIGCARDVQAQAGITLAGTVTPQRLLDYCAARSGVTLSYAGSALRETGVTVRSPGSLGDGQLWSIAHDQLSQSGHVIVASQAGNDVFVVVERAAAFDLAPVRNAADLGSELVIANYAKIRLQLESLSVEAIRELAATSFGTPRAIRNASDARSIEFVGSTGEVFVGGRIDELRLFLDLLEKLRSLDSDIAVESVSVPRGTATDMITAIQQVAQSRGVLAGRSRKGQLFAGGDDASIVLTAPQSELPFWTALIADVTRPDRVTSRVYSLAGISPDRLRETFEAALVASDPGQDSLRAFSNPLTGTLTVWTDETGHELLSQIVEDAEHPSESARRTLATIPIQHRDASSLVSDLESALSAITGGDDSAARDSVFLSQTDPNPASAIRDGQPVTPSTPTTNRSISVDEETNSLLVIGTPVEIDQIRSLVADLDVATTQVRLEVLLLSLTESQTLDLGVELDKIEITGGTTLRLSSLFGLGLQAGSSVLPGAGAGVTGVVLDPGDFSVLIQALETVNEGRTLSMPSVLVSNNQTADFNSVLQQPVVSINASDTVATTSFGGFEDAGTNISIDPQILAGDRLILNYSVTLSSFVGESSDPSVPPPRQQNQLSSSVTIPDAYTVALGGIELQTEGEGESRIPLLGSIPLLGELFKSRSISDSRSRFYVFIRANIYRDPMLERLRYSSDSLAAELAIPSNWPVIEPRVMR